MGLSLLSPQDASLTAVLPRLFADEQLSTGAVSATTSSPRPWGQRPGPQILPPQRPHGPSVPVPVPQAAAFPVKGNEGDKPVPVPQGTPSGSRSLGGCVLGTGAAEHPRGGTNLSPRL